MDQQQDGQNMFDEGGDNNVGELNPQNVPMVYIVLNI
jgi:hypothetical protein